MKYEIFFISGKSIVVNKLFADNLIAKMQIGAVIFQSSTDEDGLMYSINLNHVTHIVSKDYKI